MPETPDLVVLPDGVEPQEWTLTGSYADNSGAQSQQYTVGVAFDGSDIYVQGLAYYFQESWIKGTLTDGIATFPAWQFVGADSYGQEYLLGTPDGETASDIVFVYDAEAQTLTQQTSYILENDGNSDIYYWGYWSSVVISAEPPAVLEPVAPPADLVTELYLFQAQALEYDDETEEEYYEPYTAEVQVGFDGNDLYIQGLSTDVPELWVKATLNDAGQYVIPANQYMGQYDLGGYGYWVYDYFFTAVDAEGLLVDAVFDLDAATGTLTSSQLLALNGDRSRLYYYLLFDGAIITKAVEVAATPLAPEVLAVNLDATYPNIQLSVPTVSIDGIDLLLSRLYYQLWVEKEGGVVEPLVLSAALYEDDFDSDTQLIPYLHEGYDVYQGGSRVYLNQSADEVATWLKIGVQSVYVAAGEENQSEIGWFSLVPDAISSLTADTAPVRSYDLQGRLVNAATVRGLVIEQRQDADGTVTTRKLLRK